MGSKIHPTAIIEDGAVIGPDVTVGPNAYIGPQVKLGAGCTVHHAATIMGHTTLGDANEIFPNAVVGGKPQDLKYRGEDTELIIGSHNTFRECVTVNTGTVTGGGKTVIGNYCLVMAYAHIAHDCVLEDGVILANCVQLAGHIRVCREAILSGTAAVHHFCTIGRLSYVSGLSGVRQDVPPFMTVDGNPAKVCKLNTVALRRRNFSDDTISAIKQVYRIVYRSEFNRSQAIAKIESEGLAAVPEVGEILESFRATEKGYQGRALEGFRANGFGLTIDADAD